MPSLSALGQFRSSFNNIAHEKADIEAQNMPFDNYNLPTTEAPPFEFVRHEPPPVSAAPSSAPAPTADEGGADGSDVNSFLDNLGGDAPPPIDLPADNAMSALDDFLKEISPGSSSDAENIGQGESLPDLPSTGDLSSFLGDSPSDNLPDLPSTDDLSSFLGDTQNEGLPDLPDDDGLSSLLGDTQNEGLPDLPNTDDFNLGDTQNEGLPDLPDDDGLSSLLGDTQNEGLPDDDGLSSLLGDTQNEGLPDLPNTDDFNLGDTQNEGLPDDDGLSSLLGDSKNEGLPDDDGLSSLLGDSKDEGASDLPSTDDFNLDDTQNEGLPDDDGLSSLLGDTQNEGLPSDDGLSSLLGDSQDEGASDLPSTDDFNLTDTQDESASDLPSTDDFNLTDTQNESASDLPSTDDFNLTDTQDEGASDLPSTDDFNLTDTQDESAPADEGTAPNDLLSGLSDELESSPADFDVPDFGDTDFGSEGAGDDALGGIDLGGERQDGGLDTSGDSNFDDFNLGDTPFESGSPDTSPESFDTDGTTPDTQDIDGIDLGGESPEFTPEPASDDFSSASLPDLDLSGANDPFSDTSTDAPDTSADFSGGDASSILGDLGADFASDSIELDIGAGPELEGQESDSGFSGDSFGGDDEFALAGLDDILKKTKVSAPPPAPEKKKGLFGKKKQKAEKTEEIKAEEHIDEISLTQEEVDDLLHTLSSYPLNLRILCEELIAEQVILPEQLAKLIRLLVNGAPVKETAAHVEAITGKPVLIPRSFEKSTGAAFEAEQSSFAYIFVHNLLPVLKLFTFIALMLFCISYLSYKFIYIPIKAESIYKRGYERIPVGEYQRANELFHEAFKLHRKKKWFYSYAEAFRDQRRYMLAENKYDELLRYYPRDKKGVLDYAALNTYYLMNYDKANRLLQRELLDFAPDDFDGLLAAGDNFLDWADSNPSRFYDKYEDARFSYARLIEKYGWQVPVVERMMKYFIRTDNLKETLMLRAWFENDDHRKLSPASLAELGGYLLDKQLEKPSGVPDPYVESIESVRDMLLKAVLQDPYLPESHYHLARYHHNLGNIYEERKTLENAIRAFDLAKQESVKRRLYRVDAQYRYSNILINNREFFAADEQAVKGIELFEDFLNRNLIPASPQLGQLYALRGDLEYFVKTGNMEAALTNYKKAEGYGYSPPEVQYRMGAAYYQQENWRNALEYLFNASKELPLNRRLLFAMGNAAYQRGDYFAAQGYYNRLLDILEVQRIRLPVLLPNDNVQFLETGERLMMARNNAGVVNESLANQTGNRDFRSKAMALYAESARAWDAITRNPESMVRSRLTDSPGAPSVNLGYLNANNALRPSSDYRPQIFARIDKDALEPSRWEELVPLGGL